MIIPVNLGELEVEDQNQKKLYKKDLVKLKEKWALRKIINLMSSMIIFKDQVKKFLV